MASILNAAFCQEGAYIHIKNKLAERPIQIIHFSTGKNQHYYYNPET